MNNWIKQKIEQLRERSYCQECGTKENIEFAHIKSTGLSGRSRGRKERYYDILHNPECYRALCQSCHRKYDNEKTN